MEASEKIDVVRALHAEAQRRGLFFLSAEDERLAGRQISLNGREVVHFSSCSYLGLEHHPALVAGVHEAVDRYGTQFSSSRGYVSAPMYAELESTLDELFGGHALVTASTTLGHQVALPVLATERDAIVLDHQVHHSVHLGADLARAGGAKVEVVRHTELERALEVVTRLARTCRTVWFACDGVYSMYGDLAPMGLLRQILDVAPNVRLYVDDAHGMSWAGRHGRGSFLSRMPLCERVVVATSLNKAFSASGGCLVFADRSERERVRTCGAPMVFSGPLQPPMLGAARASARLHLTDELPARQRELASRVALTNRRMRELDLPLLVENEAPIFFVRLGLPRVSFAVAERMLAAGFYVNVSMFPSVPMRRSGIRFSITSAHAPEDIERALGTLAGIVPEVLASEKVSRADLDALFDRAVPAEARPTPRIGLAPPAPVRPEIDPASLRVEVRDTVVAVDRSEWNRMLGTVGSCSWDALLLAEQLFSGQKRPEHNWTFRYVIVRDPEGRPLAATFFTVALTKDDMLMRDEVSRAVEHRRRDDPYFLTSQVVGMGSGFTEGNHLFLERGGPWRAALTRLLAVMTEEYDRREAGLLLLRDLPGNDPEMDAFLMDQGLVKVPMFDSHYLDRTWTDTEGFLATLSRRARHHFREIADRSRDYTRRVYSAAEGTGGGLSETELDHLYALYRNVADRKQKLNVFPLPPNLPGAILSSPAWEVVTFCLSPEAGGPADGRPVAWYAAHRHDGHYAPFLCGLDYRFVYSHGAYRNMLLAMVERMGELGATQLHMGMDADTEKSRLGTRIVRNAVYIQARDHYQAGILREIVAQVGMESARRSLSA